MAENMGGFAVFFLCHWSGELAIPLLSRKTDSDSVPHGSLAMSHMSAELLKCG